MGIPSGTMGEEAEATESREMQREAEAATAAFDPRRHLTKISGGDYLPAAARVAWLRHEYPDAELVAELVDHDKPAQGRQGFALFRCSVTVPSTGAKATAYGSETSNDFGDYIEKAETKAVARALGRLGLGTPMDDEGGAPADTPRGGRQGNQAQNGAGNRGGGGRAGPREPNAPATPAQVQYLYRLANEHLAGGAVEMDAYLMANAGVVGANELTKGAISGLIDRLQGGQGLPQGAQGPDTQAPTSAPHHGPHNAPRGDANGSGGKSDPDYQRKALRLDRDHDAQVQDWTRRLSAGQVRDGDEEAWRNLGRMAVAACLADDPQRQAWRFTAMAIMARTEGWLDTIGEKATEVGAFSPELDAAIANRRKDLQRHGVERAAQAIRGVVDADDTGDEDFGEDDLGDETSLQDF